MARLNPDGTPDTTFGSGGLVVTPLPGDDCPRSLTIQPDGKIVAVGNHDYNFLVARYNAADGSPDVFFGVNGVALSGDLQNPNQPGVAIAFQPVDVALEPDGRIVVAGSQDYSTTGHDNYALARFMAAGPQIGSISTSPNPGTAGSSVTLTAGNVVVLNPGSTIMQVAFYQDSNGNGVLDSGDALLGYGTQTSTGIWALTFSTTGLTSGRYTLVAQAEDSYGVFSDPLATTVQVN